MTRPLGVADYTALSGATVVVTFRRDDVDDAVRKTWNDHPAVQVLAVLKCVRTWNITDQKPSRRAWRELVPIDVAEGVAAAMILAMK